MLASPLRGKIISYIAEQAKGIFGVFLIAYLIFLLIEEFEKGFISFTFDINIILFIVLVSACLISFPKKETIVKNKKDFFLVGLLGVAFSYLLFIKMTGLGWLTWFVPLVFFFLFFGLFAQVLNKNG